MGWITESTDDALCSMVEGYANDFRELYKALDPFADLDREKLGKARELMEYSIILMTQSIKNTGEK